MKSILFCTSMWLAASSLLVACGDDATVPDTYTVGGTVTGLVGSGLVLTNDGVDLAIDADGPFELARTFLADEPYGITVTEQPTEPAQVCTVVRGAGAVSSDVDDVAVTCVTTPVTLATSTPADGATGVARTTTPSLTFSLPLDASSVAGNVTLSRGDMVLAASVATLDDTVTVTPAVPFSLLTTYTVSAEVGLLGTYGEPLAAETNVSFTTRDGTWHAPTTVKLDAPNAQEPDVAILLGGNAVAVWQEYNGSISNIWGNLYTVGTGWGTPELVEMNDTGDAAQPSIVSDARGRAFVVWQQSNGTRVDIWGNRYVVGEGWSGAGQLSDSGDGNGNDSPRVGTNADGDTVFAWVNTASGDRSVWARRVSQAGVLGDPVRIESVVGDASATRVVVGSDGAATVLFGNYDSGAGTVDLWANHASNGTWGTAARVETVDESLSEYSLAADGTGGVVAAWTQAIDGSSQGVYARRWQSSTGWGTVATLGTTTDSSAYYPTAAADAEGNAMVVWGQYDSSVLHQYSSYYTADTATWGAPVLTEANIAADLSFDASGNALMVWGAEVSSTNRVIRASRFTVANGWATPVLVTPGATAYAYYPEFATDPFGNAVVVFIEYDYPNNRSNIAGSRFDDSP